MTIAERLGSITAVKNQIPIGWRRALFPEVAFALGALFSALPDVMALEPGAGGSGGTVPLQITTAVTSAEPRHAEWTACGLAPERIQAFDAKGIPLVCATGLVPAAAAPQSRTRMGNDPTLPETRGWEAIPGVLRADDVDTCILEVDVGSAVRRVELIPNVPAPADTGLRDDGQGADRIAGDGVYTIGPLGGRSTAAMPPTYCWDPSSPAGVDTVDLGRVLVVETEGSTNEFLVEPAVGMLRTEVALVPTLQLSSTLQRSAHVINLRSSSRTTQSALRFLGEGRMADLTAPLDRYLMGLIPAEAVPPLHVYGGSFKPPGSVVQPEEIVRTVSIDEILAVHGARSPGPDAAQRSFTIACVVESRDRLLTPCEMTFYELFAEHLARVLPEEAPAPFVTHGWQPIQRYFGEGTTWTTRLPASYLENPPPPRLIHLEIENEDVRLTWQTMAAVVSSGSAARTARVNASPGPLRRSADSTKPAICSRSIWRPRDSRCLTASSESSRAAATAATL